MTGKSFVSTEEKAQAAFFARAIQPDKVHDVFNYRLKPGQHLLNLAPGIRNAACNYFGPPRDIVWHQHANHGLSSQACCLNFLMPLATQPQMLEKVIGLALGLEGITVLPIESEPEQEPWHVAFEWIGRDNYLGEWRAGKKPPRGANVTSADAAVTFQNKDKVETVLIEWKYTEKYGAALRPKGNATRIGRYAEKAFAPNGPIRSDLNLTVEDFFWDPLYQLLRQQMLAWRMERAGENGAERVSVLHISPAGNVPLHKVTAPALRRFGDDVFSVFRTLLVRPETFVSLSTEQVFGPFLNVDHADPAAQKWVSYLCDRYSFLSAVRNQNG
jgi:hypothetical protein